MRSTANSQVSSNDTLSQLPVLHIPLRIPCALSDILPRGFHSLSLTPIPHRTSRFDGDLSSKVLIKHTMLSLCFLSLFASSLAAPIIQRFSASSQTTALPVVIWHGLGDSASNDGLQELAHDLTSALNSTVYLIHFAEGSGDQSVLSMPESSTWLKSE